MMWARHVERMGRNCTLGPGGAKLKEKDQLEDLEIDGKVMLTWA
jgi:hypothetical protein